MTFAYLQSKGQIIGASDGELPRFFQMPSDEVLWKTSWDLYLGYFLNIRRVESQEQLVSILVSTIYIQQLRHPSHSASTPTGGYSQ